MRTLRSGLALLLLAAALLAGCGGDDDGGDGAGGTTSGTTASAEATAGEKYPDEVRENFMRECEKSSGGKTEICQCSLNKLEERLSLEDFKKEEAAIAAGNPASRRITDAVAECS
jgi:hypothetical protein